MIGNLLTFISAAGFLALSALVLQQLQLSRVRVLPRETRRTPAVPADEAR